MRDVLAIEVTCAAVRAVRLRGIGPGRGVQAYRERALPPGLLVPSSSAPNIRDEAAFARLLAEAVGPCPPRYARLVLPDRSVRFHVLHTDAAAPAGPDLRQYLRWRLQETLPFDAREARVAYARAANGLPDRHTTIALVAREQVLVQYERLLAAADTSAAHVAPAACHLFSLAQQAPQAAGTSVLALLVLGPESATVILAERDTPDYIRTFARPGVPPEPRDPAAALRDMPVPPPPWGQPPSHKELTAELLRSFDHAAEEAGVKPPTHVLLGGEMGRDAGLAAALQEELGLPCALLPPPMHRVSGAQRVPPEAHAVLLAALARL